jgi:hypothetical protein
MRKKTMQKEVAIPKDKNDVTAVDIRKGTSLDLRHVAGPERGQHAFAAHLQTQLTVAT